MGYAHDGAGNLTEIAYPGGDVFRRTYDTRRRLTSIARDDGSTIARFEYGGVDHLLRGTLGDVIEATYAYDAQQRLESIEYRSTADGELVDGFRYAYDEASRMTHEVQLRHGDSYGERYAFDDAGRPLRARYGIEDLADPGSSFEWETSYTQLLEGSWHARRDVDGEGNVLSDRVGVVDALNRYESFGDVSFEYDGRGNRIRKSSAAGWCLYTYDDANRLVRVECRDPADQLLQAIDYEYDPLGRLVRKVVTDALGHATETDYAWTGFLLAEEYDGGHLARAYVHGIGSRPVMFSTYEGARTDYVYTFNGRGLASGLAPKDDPNAFAERYGYELTGSYFPTEVGGVSVALPARNSTASSLRNSLVTGDSFGSVLSDWDVDTLAGFGGGQMDKTLASALNSLGDIAGKGHQGVKGALAAQLNSIIGMLGLAGNASAAGPAAPASGSSTQVPPGGPDWKLYADGDDGDTDGGTKTGQDGGTKTGQDGGTTTGQTGQDGGTKTGQDGGTKTGQDGGTTTGQTGQDGGTKTGQDGGTTTGQTGQDGGTKTGQSGQGGQPADAPTNTPLTPKDAPDPGGLKGGAAGGGAGGGANAMDKVKDTLNKIPLHRGLDADWRLEEGIRRLRRGQRHFLHRPGRV